jgi:hypothetical protein
MTTKIAERPARNGVDVPMLFATLDAVKGQPELAKFQFRASNRWIRGTHSQSSIRRFFGAGQEDANRTEDFTYDADHPPVLTGANNGPTPVEFVLHALASCLTAGLVNIAAARGVTLHEVTSHVEGDIDHRLRRGRGRRRRPPPSRHGAAVGGTAARHRVGGGNPGSRGVRGDCRSQPAARPATA